MIHTIINRLSYGITALTFLGMALIFLTGTPKIEYRVTFGNAAAAETVQLSASPDQLNALAHAGANPLPNHKPSVKP